MAMISIGREGKSFGNFSEETVREGLRSGRFLATDLGWREGMATWQPLSQFAEFTADMPAGAVSPPPPTPPATLATALPVTTPAAIPKTEPLAIWSLVLSLVGLFCCGFVLGVPGIVCGHLALSKIRKEPALQGRGLAIAGLVIGYVAVGFWLLWIIFFGGTAFLQGISRGMSR
jgi:hypothetical protein